MIALISQMEVEGSFNRNRDVLEVTYVEYFEKEGFQLIPVSNSTNNIEKYFEFGPHLLILTGGKDSYNRGKIEKKLVAHAIEKKIPILGICKGMQLINTYFGGHLINLNDHAGNQHEITLSDGKKEMVNSFHDQGINDEGLGEDLQSFARSNDGYIEGIYHSNLDIMGILWHPERSSPNDEFNKELIINFLKNKSFWRQK